MQRLLKLFAALLIAGCATASAQSQSNDSPPLIAGRVSLAEGDFQIWRTEEDADGEWDLAQINDVVTVGTGLYTGSDGRAEFRVGPTRIDCLPAAAVVSINSITAMPYSISKTVH